MNDVRVQWKPLQSAEVISFFPFSKNIWAGHIFFPHFPNPPQKTLPGLSSKRTKPAPWNRYPFNVGRNCSHVQHDAMATNTKKTLQTSWATELTEPPWAEHPRPQLRRASWKTLNGWWRCRTVEVAADATKNDDFEEMLKVRDAWLELVLTWKFGRSLEVCHNTNG